MIAFQLAATNAKSDQARQNAVHSLILKYQPTHLVLERTNAHGFRKSKRTKGLIRALALDASALGLKIIHVSSPAIREAIGAPSEASKYELSQALTNHFAELIPYLPKPKKDWETEDKRIAVFMALAMVMTAFGR